MKGGGRGSSVTSGGRGGSMISGCRSVTGGGRGGLASGSKVMGGGMLTGIGSAVVPIKDTSFSNVSALSQLINSKLTAI